MFWKSLLVLVVLSAQSILAAEPTPAEESIVVTVVGTVRTGVVMIGGETTGVTIKSKGATFELDFGKNADLRKQAATLDGKTAAVAGHLERRSGVEVRERWILQVTSLRLVQELPK